jgi:hypothetical protein
MMMTDSTKEILITEFYAKPSILKIYVEEHSDTISSKDESDVQVNYVFIQI